MRPVWCHVEMHILTKSLAAGCVPLAKLIRRVRRQGQWLLLQVKMRAGWLWRSLRTAPGGTLVAQGA